MSAAALFDLYRHGALALLALAGPCLVAAAVIGLAVGFVQALFNLQDAAIGFAVKLVVILAVLGATGLWSLQYAATWTHAVLAGIATPPVG